MSSSRVRYVKNVIGFTATWATNLLTVTTATNHNLVTGDIVYLTTAQGPQEYVGAATVTGATTFTVADATAKYAGFTGGYVTIRNFRATGTFAVTAPVGTGVANTTVQSFIVGTAGATYQINGSLDGVHWSAIGSAVTHTSNDVKSSAINASWPYLQFVISAIGASTSLAIMYSC